jgi:hypothetical protein
MDYKWLTNTVYNMKHHRSEKAKKPANTGLAGSYGFSWKF